MDTDQKQNSRWIQGKLIGKGSYGTVSLGIRESDGEIFAVKSAGKDSLSSIDALESEIEILRSLSSPFIVEYYGDDETFSHRNLHLEYVSGGDVARMGGIADVELIRSYTWCLVMALRTVHSHGIVHCDVKGSNVLLAGAGVAKLADFGSARRLNHPSDAHKPSEVSFQHQQSKIVPCGSPLWMAPEVVRGESQGFEADIWSLGCTVIEMFTGLPAWQDHGAHTLYKIGYSDELPEYPARLPELGRDFINKCLNRDPSRRWSCDQLLQHPFLLPAPTGKVIVESSPRSVLDNWPDLDFSDDDFNFSPTARAGHNSGVVVLEDFDDQVSARERVGKLATSSGVNWESDGWVEVRSLSLSLIRKEEKEEEFETGTSSEYCDSDEGMEVILTTVEEYECDYPMAINSDAEEREIGGGGGGGDGGSEFGAVRREKIETVVLIDLLLFVTFLLYSPTNMGFNYNNNNDNKNKLFVDKIMFFWFLLWCFHFYFIFSCLKMKFRASDEPKEEGNLGFQVGRMDRRLKFVFAKWFIFLSNVFYFKSTTIRKICRSIA